MLSTAPHSVFKEPIEFNDPKLLVGRQTEALALIGFFDTKGPTLVSLTLVHDGNSPSGAVLFTSLNPFVQTRQFVARVANEAGAGFTWLSEISNSMALVCGLPGMVLTTLGDEVGKSELLKFMSYLVVNADHSQALSEVITSYREHPSDPWARLPADEELTTKTSVANRNHHDSADFDPKEIGEWAQIVTSREHFYQEFVAIAQEWKASIEKTDVTVLVMPFTEAMAELTALGFPFGKLAE